MPADEVVSYLTAAWEALAAVDLGLIHIVSRDGSAVALAARCHLDNERALRELPDVIEWLAGVSRDAREVYDGDIRAAVEANVEELVEILTPEGGEVSNG